MKIAFATAVQLGLSCIEGIYEIGGNLDLLITLRDERSRAKSGRIYLDDFANEHSIPLLKINNINDPIVIETVKSLGIDWLLIIGWSQIALRDVITAPNYGCIGMHPTLLPCGRGRAAIPWAILKGLEATGVTIFKIDEGVDTGPIIGQIRIPISPHETATELYAKANAAHVQLIQSYWSDLQNNSIKLLPQDNNMATYWPERKPQDGEVTQGMTMVDADRLVRAVTYPYPGAFFREGSRVIRIWAAKTTQQIDHSHYGIALPLRDGYLLPIDYGIEDSDNE